jgi:hypothetical protein
MEKMQKQTPLQKAIAEIEARIKYLREQELIALNEIDELVAGSFMRNMKWKLINELAARRGELEMCSLKPLQALLPLERQGIEAAYFTGIWGDATSPLLTDDDRKKAQDYFNKTYSAEK